MKAAIPSLGAQPAQRHQKTWRTGAEGLARQVFARRLGEALVGEVGDDRVGVCRVTGG